MNMSSLNKQRDNHKSEKIQLQIYLTVFTSERQITEKGDSYIYEEHS